MRQILTFLLTISSLLLFGQPNQKISLSLNFQPELTFYKNNYAFRWHETYTKSSFNPGFGASIEYRLTNRILIDAGLGYMSGRLETVAFLNQGALPPPKQSLTKELNITKSVSLRTLQFPINLGYKFLGKGKLNFLLIAGLTANFLLNTFYGFGPQSKQYEGTYKKNCWQGFSGNLGFGADYKVSDKIALTSSITYSIFNTVRKDPYLSSQDESQISLSHKYLGISLGLKFRL